MAHGSRNYTAAQTAIVLEAVANNERITFMRVAIYLDNTTTVNVAAGVQFTGNPEFISRHPGIAPGSGFVEIAPKGVALAEGELGQDLTFTCAVPTSGSIQVNYTYERHRF